MDSARDCYELTARDYILILGGINDSNPFRFKMCVSSWLNNIPFANILISEIPYNKHLNENKLNNELRHICTMFKNVTYIDMGYKNLIPPETVLSRNLCQFVSTEINCIERKKSSKTMIDSVKIRNSITSVGTQTDYCVLVSPKLSSISNSTKGNKAKGFFRTQ